MLNFNQTTNKVADNEVVINGFSFGFLTDDDTQKLVSIIKGMQSGAVSAPKSGLVFADEQPKKAKEIAPAQDYKVVIEGKDNAVWYSATAQDVRQVVNNQLKLAGFTYDKDYERPDIYKKDYTGKDGVLHKAGSHKLGAWTLMKGSKKNLKDTAEWIGKEITVTAAERDIIRQGWEARKAKRG